MPRALRFVRTPWFAFAAAALLFLLLGDMALEISVGNEQVRVRVATGDARATHDLALAAFAPSEVEYKHALEDLLHSLEARRGHMRPETIAVFEKSLSVIDLAIHDAREALVQDPASRDLAFLLSAVYEAKLDLLREATRLPDEI